MCIENNPVSIGYSPQKSEIVLVSSHANKVHVIHLNLTSTNIVYTPFGEKINGENGSNPQSNMIAVRDFITFEFSIRVNNTIKPILDALKPLRLITKPLYDGYIVYQHGTCGFAWYIDHHYQLSPQLQIIGYL